MTKPTSSLPELIERVFSRIERDLEGSNKTYRDYCELYSLFGETLEHALNTLDTTKILLYESEDKTKSFIEISGRNRGVYKLFPNVNYCSCSSFLFNVLTSQNQYTCKHVLALKLAVALEKLEIQTLTNNQFNFMLKQIAN